MKLFGAEHLKEFYAIVKRQRLMGPLLILYVDGLGFEQYMEQYVKGNLPFLSENFLISSMETVQETLTNPAFATMVTGKMPKEHGAFGHKEHQLKLPSFFEGEENAALIEGDSIILNLETRSNLNTAENGIEIDDKIFESAKKAIQDKKELILVHFHEVDDMGHEFGPDSKEYEEQLRKTDDNIRALYELFHGTTFLISDHGITQGKNGGSHGSGTDIERFVPFGIALPDFRRTVNGYTGFSVSKLCQILGYKGQVIIYGEDGFGVACSKEEIAEAEAALLVSDANGYRVVFPKESYSRRWCKNILRIECEEEN